MKRSSKFLSSLRTFTSNTTVHGLSYISDQTLPIFDRLVWFVIVVAFGVFSAYLSNGVLNAWQTSVVETTLKETELDVTQVDFPAITICSEGLNMDAVEKVIQTDFMEWKEQRRSKREPMNEQEEIDLFLQSIYGISHDQSIFEIIIGLVADDPNKSFTNNLIRES